MPKSRCKRGHPFEGYRVPSSGKQVCRICKRARQLARQRRVRQEVVAFFGGQCASCGYNTAPRALQLDHINGGGRPETARLGACGVRQRAMEYPEYYQLLCANCNQIKAAQEKERSTWDDDRRAEAEWGLCVCGKQSCPYCWPVQSNTSSQRNSPMGTFLVS